VEPAIASFTQGLLAAASAKLEQIRAQARADVELIRAESRAIAKAFHEIGLALVRLKVPLRLMIQHIVRRHGRVGFGASRRVPEQAQEVRHCGSMRENRDAPRVTIGNGLRPSRWSRRRSEWASRAVRLAEPRAGRQSGLSSERARAAAGSYAGAVRQPAALFGRTRWWHDFLLDVLLAEHDARVLPIMGGAEQTNTLECRWTSECKGLPVFERQEMAFAAASPFGVHKRALTLIALPDRPRDLDRNVARALFELSLLAGLARPETLTSLFFNQRVEGAPEQLAEIAVRHGMAQELARSFELVSELGAGRELHAVARGREWLEPVWASRIPCPGAGSFAPRAL
jgi:hypothetical protein